MKWNKWLKTHQKQVCISFSFLAYFSDFEQDRNRNLDVWINGTRTCSIFWVFVKKCTCVENLGVNQSLEIPLKNEKSRTLNVEVIYPSLKIILVGFDFIFAKNVQITIIIWFIFRLEMNDQTFLENEFGKLERSEKKQYNWMVSLPHSLVPWLQLVHWSSNSPLNAAKPSGNFVWKFLRKSSDSSLNKECVSRYPPS